MVIIEAIVLFVAFCALTYKIGKVGDRIGGEIADRMENDKNTKGNDKD